ncbi:hypothetical protein [Dactylosporangium sp. NPDC000521]|uniref:hypothetical protein n=1 Tax=Dactylosporangium sp. NPDC000521 TaxID=3363975 RepID=UPI0036AD1169
MRDRYMQSLADDEVWRCLTTLRVKFDYFAVDANFRESWRTAVDVLGPRAPWLLQRIALLTVRPEGVIARKAHPCVRTMIERDFLPIYGHRCCYNRVMIRDLWRYQWNVATLDRLAIGDRVHYLADALNLVFMDVSSPLLIPAASRLTAHKGSASPEARRADHIRSVLGAPNRIMVVVHCPDEPMDVVRELGILFDRAALTTLYATLADRVAGGVTADPTPQIEELYAEVTARSLSVEDACAAVTARLDGCGGGAARRAAAALGAARAGGRLDWDRWAADLHECGFDPDDWAVTVVASQYVEHDLPGAACLISRTGRQLWQAGEGRMVGTA